MRKGVASADSGLCRCVCVCILQARLMDFRCQMRKGVASSDSGLRRYVCVCILQARLMDCRSQMRKGKGYALILIVKRYLVKHHSALVVLVCHIPHAVLTLVVRNTSFRLSPQRAPEVVHPALA